MNFNAARNALDAGDLTSLRRLAWAEHGHPEHLATMRALLGERKD